MKKSLLLLLLFSAVAVGQNTVVSSTMTDTDGVAWAGAMWKIDFRPGPSNPNESGYRLLNGQPLTTTVTHQTGSADASGQFSFTIYDSTLIVPTGSGWTLTLCSTTSAPCGTYQFTSAGSSMDLSSRLTTAIAAPRFSPGSNAYGYADVEAQVSINQGSTYWNVISNVMRVWNGIAWATISGGGTSTPPGGNINEVQINNGTVFGAASGVTYDGSGGLVASSGGLAGQRVGGSCYAKQWQTPPSTGSNGIANAMAGCTAIISDPTYAVTTTANTSVSSGVITVANSTGIVLGMVAAGNVPSQTTVTGISGLNISLSKNPFSTATNFPFSFQEQPAISNVTNTPSSFTDQRNGFITEYFRNPGVDSSGNPAYIGRLFGGNLSYGRGDWCMFDATYPNWYPWSRAFCNIIQLTSITPGYDMYNIWHIPVTLNLNNFSHSRGTGESLYIQQSDHGVGDKAAIYCYSWGDGGQVASSAEGQKCYAANTQENNYTFGGTVKSVSTATNPSQITTNVITSQLTGATPGAPGPGVGRLLIALGTCSNYPSICTPPPAPYSGKILNNAPGRDYNITAITVDQTIPLSTASGFFGGNNPLTSVDNAVSGTTTYHGTGLAGVCPVPNTTHVVITGFSASGGRNNGNWSCASATATTLVLNTGTGIAETGTGFANQGCGDGNINMSPPFSTVTTCPLHGVTGTPNTTSLICIDDTAHDCAYPTAFSTTSITIPLRFAHSPSAGFYQGGLAGYCLEFPAYTMSPAGQPIRNCWDVFGSTTGNVLQIGYFMHGNVQSLYSQFQPYNKFTIQSNISSSGTTVSVTVQTMGGAAYTPGGSVYISGSDSGVLDGQCNNLQETNPVSNVPNATFTCTNPNLSGTHQNTTQAPTGQQMSVNCSYCSATAGLTLDQYRLYPSAEVLDVRNNATPPVVDGTLTLEPNVFSSVNMPVGTYVEQPHHIAGQYQGATSNVTAYNTWTAGFNSVNFHEVAGSGFSGGGLSLASTTMGAWLNDNPESMYSTGGGILSPPNLFRLGGLYNSYFLLDRYPAGGPSQGSIIMVNPSTPTQWNDPAYVASIFFGYTKVGVTSWTLRPNTGDMNWFTNGTTTYQAGQHTFVGPVNMNQVTAVTLGGLVSGAAVNYAPYSNDYTQTSYWQRNGQAAGTVTCGILDDFGNAACQIVQTTGNGTTCPTGQGCGWNMQNIPSSTTGLTPLPTNGPVTIQVHLRGAVGGEPFTLGIGVQSSSAFHATTSWQDYCWQTNAVNPTYQYWFASINQTTNLTPSTLYISNVVVRPGTACGPPILTTNNQILTPTPVNHYPSFANGIVALPTGTLAQGSCYPNVTVAVATMLPKDVLEWNFSGTPDPTWGELIIHAFTDTGVVGWQICNPPGTGPANPVAANITWKVNR